MGRRRGAALLLAVALLTGCYSMSTLQEPETLPKGGVRFTPKVRVTQGAAFTYNRPVARATAEGQLRIGLAERLELQVGAGSDSMARIGIKALLVDWDALRLAVVLAYQDQIVYEDIDSAFDEESDAEYHVRTAIIPLIAGVPVADRLDLLLGVDGHFGRRRAAQYAPEARAERPVVAFAAHVGLAWHARGGWATLLPQCGVLVSAAGGKPSFGDEVLRRGYLRWECAFGVSLGTRYARKAE